MSPSRSITSVCPSGETSTDIHVPSLTSKPSLRASARAALMSAATSFFAGADAFFASSAASEHAARVKSRATRDRLMRVNLRAEARPGLIQATGRLARRRDYGPVAPGGAHARRVGDVDAPAAG